MVVEVGDARLHVEHGRHRLEEILARGVFVVDEGLRQVRVGVARRAAFDVGARALLLLDLVEAKDAGLDRRPGEEVDQPARRDATSIGVRLGGVGELPRRAFAQGSAFDFIDPNAKPLRILAEPYPNRL